MKKFIISSPEILHGPQVWHLLVTCQSLTSLVSATPKAHSKQVITILQLLVGLVPSSASSLFGTVRGEVRTLT